MRIATWNVNSIRARHDRLVNWLKKHNPDVLCLQELKVEEPKYPRDALAELGYVSAINAQKTYNGVAILSKHPLAQVAVGMADGVEDPQARLVAATVNGVRVISVYVPNGESLTSEKWPYKLTWMQRLRNWLDRHESKDTPLVLCGDFNVAPDAIDTYDPALWEGETLYHPKAREALENVRQFGLVDTFRLKHPGEEKCYSWWDYRQLGFQKGKGLRIDHIYATQRLADRCTESVIDREERKGDAPSDHAPVISTFDI
jgi:exodeoxyribonuclease-3